MTSRINAQPDAAEGRVMGRRQMMLGVAAAAVATPAAALPSSAGSDPLRAMIQAYRDEEEIVDALDWDELEDFEHKAFSAIWFADEPPPAKTRETAMMALRLAKEFSEIHEGYGIALLSIAALTYFEREGGQ